MVSRGHVAQYWDGELHSGPATGLLQSMLLVRKVRVLPWRQAIACNCHRVSRITGITAPEKQHRHSALPSETRGRRSPSYCFEGLRCASSPPIGRTRRLPLRTSPRPKPCQATSHACQPVSLSACQPVSLSACQPVSLSACQPVSLSACQPVSLSVTPSKTLVEMCQTPALATDLGGAASSEPLTCTVSDSKMWQKFCSCASASLVLFLCFTWPQRLRDSHCGPLTRSS